VRFVNHAFQMSSWKKVRGLKCFAGVKSLNERGNRRRGGTGLRRAEVLLVSLPGLASATQAGRCGTGFVMQWLDFNPNPPGVKWKIVGNMVWDRRAPSRLEADPVATGETVFGAPFGGKRCCCRNMPHQFMECSFWFFQ
jgi:hypothetical protein